MKWCTPTPTPTSTLSLPRTLTLTPTSTLPVTHPKGRQCAGLIYENWLAGRKKHIWVSSSADLHLDATRDLNDLTGQEGLIKVHELRGTPYLPLKAEEGVVFSTYSLLVREFATKHANAEANANANANANADADANDDANPKAKTKPKAEVGLTSRLDQLVEWCGDGFDGCIFFDECHKAKNLTKGTKAGIKVQALQDRLPNARVVYCSATGVSEPANMAYMVRLGLWGPGSLYPNFARFTGSLTSRGMGAMEMLAAHLKRDGSLMSRTLAFSKCSFELIDDVMDGEQEKIYNRAAKFWIKLREEVEASIETDFATELDPTAIAKLDADVAAAQEALDAVLATPLGNGMGNHRRRLALQQHAQRSLQKVSLSSLIFSSFLAN